MKLLRIDSSPRAGGSYSRQVGDQLEKALAPSTVTRRDLTEDPTPHLTSTAIQGFFMGTDTDALRDAVRMSNTIIGEVKSADAIMITTPMFNFGIPSVLKAWVDQLVRINQTFSYDGTSFTGLVTGKTAYVVVSYGAAGYANNGPFSAGDFAKPYLDFTLRFLGFTDVHFIQVEGTNAGPDALKAALDSATKSVATIAKAKR